MLDVATLRELVKSLTSRTVKPTGDGVFFVVASEQDLRRNLAELGFTPEEIEDIMGYVVLV